MVLLLTLAMCVSGVACNAVFGLEELELKQDAGERPSADSGDDATEGGGARDATTDDASLGADADTSPKADANDANLDVPSSSDGRLDAVTDVLIDVFTPTDDGPRDSANGDADAAGTTDGDGSPDGSGNADAADGQSAADGSDASPTLTSIAVSPSNPSIPLGSKQSFTATGTYSNATMQDVTSLAAWTSETTTVSTITTSGTRGVATAVGQGSTKITATMNAVSGSTNLTVGPAALQSIAVTPANPSIPVGGSVQLAAMGTYTDMSMIDLVTTATWLSSDTTVATLGATPATAGKVTGVTIGSTTISATVGAIVGSTPLAVTPPVLQSITVTGGGAMDIHYGFMAQFSATGHYSDGSTPNITTMVTWASSNPSVVTIDPTGLAYGASLGTSTISATLGTIVGTQSVSVIP